MYEGQPPTCYSCNEQAHEFQDCPRRKQPDTRQEDTQNPSWADVVTQGTRDRRLTSGAQRIRLHAACMKKLRPNL